MAAAYRVCYGTARTQSIADSRHDRIGEGGNGVREVVMIGAGLHRYGVFPDRSYLDLGVTAIQGALQDAGCSWADIEAVYCGTVRLGMSAGHNICLRMGPTGLAITNVENASASGSSAFREAYLAIAAGEHGASTSAL